MRTVTINPPLLTTIGHPRQASLRPIGCRESATQQTLGGTSCVMSQGVALIITTSGRIANTSCSRFSRFANSLFLTFQALYPENTLQRPSHLFYRFLTLFPYIFNLQAVISRNSIHQWLGCCLAITCFISVSFLSFLHCCAAVKEKGRVAEANLKSGVL